MSSAFNIPAGWKIERSGQAASVIEVTAPDGIRWCVVAPTDEDDRERKIGAFFHELCAAMLTPVDAVPGEPLDLGPVYVPDDQGPEDVRYVREDRALAAIACAASVAVPGEPVADEAIFSFTPGAFKVLNAESDRLAASVASRAGMEPGKMALAEMEARKDGAYLERNQVVAALAKAFPSGIARTAIEGWSDDWHGCVYIDLPTGQASWHFHDSQAYLFAGLPPYAGQWDGHDTPEKYRRLAALTAPAAPAEAKDAVRAEPAGLPHPGGIEISALLDSILAEYNWPTNTKNAARAGWTAAMRYLAAPSTLRQPEAAGEAPAAAAEPSEEQLNAACLRHTQAMQAGLTSRMAMRRALTVAGTVVDRERAASLVASEEQLDALAEQWVTESLTLSYDGDGLPIQGYRITKHRMRCFARAAASLGSN